MNSTLWDQIDAGRLVTPRTLMLIGEEKTASWQWRVAWPSKALSDRGFVADWCLSQNITTLMPLINAGRYNTLITPRAHWNDSSAADQWLDMVHSAGMAWVYELDDDGWSPDIVHRQSKLFEQEWKKGEQRLEEERQERIRIIRMADGVVVSSEHLAEVARSYTDRPVYCVPNLIDDQWFADRQNDAKRIIAPVTVGWSGGLRDENDLSIVAEAWSELAKYRPEVKFVVHGTTPKPLMDAVPADRLTILGWSSLPDYPRALMNIDVMCCAVAEDVDGTHFNRSKTAIKWYEATLSGSACVVSPTLYGSEVRDGHDAFVANTAEDWKVNLIRLTESPSERRRINKNARKSVLAKHSLSGGWKQWITALSGSLDYYRHSKLEVLHAA